MIFGTLDSLIQRCEEHLNLTGTRSTDIENYFVQFLLVRICAEYEIRITTLVHRRCARTTDVHLKAFADDHAEYVCRRFSITNIRRTLARFGDDYAKAFHNQV